MSGSAGKATRHSIWARARISTFALASQLDVRGSESRVAADEAESDSRGGGIALEGELAGVA